MKKILCIGKILSLGKGKGCHFKMTANPEVTESKKRKETKHVCIAITVND